ncbi:MAG: hypothetical protein LV480_04550 [Methylacidiphilales bacterium]|nr:hypothetical protein [Candidatus Methylacidiphilales bacterium]
MFESAIKPIWWLPSFGFFLFCGIELWMFATPGHIFADPGVGRHLRTAEFILETGQIPRADPLSFTKAGQPWVDFEWAFETTLGELYRAGGLPLVCAFCHAIFAATVLGIYRTLLQSGLSLSVVLLSTGVAFLTLQVHFSARPVLFTYLFMALVVEVWNRRTVPLLRDWLILPVVFVAWANLHAGWMAALLFLALAMAGRLLDRIFKRVDGEEAPLIPWIGLTLLCTLATSLNPWGWELHRHVFLMATTLKSAALWDEYLPPNFSSPNMPVITIMLIVGVVFIARVFRRVPLWRWETALPVLFFLYEGLKAQRHVLLLMEVAAVPVARDLEVVLHGAWWPILRERLKEFQATQRLAGGDAWLALMAALVLTALFVRTPIAREIHVGGNVSPQLVAFLKDHPDRFHRPLTTTWNAGPLLWNMRPDFRVSFDDRGDFYGDDTVFSFVNMTNGSAGWREKLQMGNYDSLILDPYLKLNKLLRSLPEWKEVYRDEHAVVYWRDN